MSATPLLDRILDELAGDLELERLLRSHASMALEDAHDQVAESFAVLCEEVLPSCGGDDWKVLTYIWSKTWLVGCAATFVPLAPAQVASETGVALHAVWRALDVLIERGMAEYRPPAGPEQACVYRLRIRSLEAA